MVIRSTSESITTSRSQRKARYLVDYINRKFGPGRFEAVDVPDILLPNVYDYAVRGVSGIIHIASVLTLSSDPGKSSHG
jgi:hypothetical protein